MHFYHLEGVLSQDRERLGRAVGLCSAIAGAGALFGGISSLVGHGEACSFLAVADAAVLLVDCGTGVVAVPCFQFVRPRNFRK